ncbi:pyridoxal phosphate-dependent decarboxylase family protein [Gordonia rhizosphera]|uniref:Putative decarboxylase n=1 Tax=Gordonia rhizosphera NBRC 16068 TaxID=1108045 RepID=K6WIN3_9ACTN|nr:pyridoxal-dependent decarboxylase [Gordonia rhizosphera]GAB92022.1 putative decarboxylase [Gordonia rhizosphera NBRC 16068]
MTQPADGAGTELELLADADRRARRWTEGIGSPGRAVFPAEDALATLRRRVDEPLSDRGHAPADTLAMLDEVVGAGVVASNDPRYFGFVVGSTLPVAAAAERLVLAWDQCAPAFDNSPAAHVVEKQAGRWALEALDLPRSAAVGFTTSSGSGAVVALTAARRDLLARQGWDVDRRGLIGTPHIRVVMSELAHVAIVRAVRVLGFGLDTVERIPVDEHGRVRTESVPPLDERTILILQAGEVNTGEFDPFADVLPVARAAGAWVHIDGAFGLWARASRSHRYLTDAVDLADSWTTDGHKWLNTPYDAAMLILRDAQALSSTMNSDTAYLSGDEDAQKNLTLELSRRARGISVWAALRTLGSAGVEDLVDRCISLAQYAAEGLRAGGFTVLNRVVLNQVLVRADTPEQTIAVREHAATAAARTNGCSTPPTTASDQPETWTATAERRSSSEARRGSASWA